MRYFLSLLLVSCLCLWSCGSGEYELVNETKYAIDCTGWIVGMDSSTEVISLEPGQSLTVKAPPHDSVTYNVCTDAGIAYFDDTKLKKAKRVAVRINGNYPQLVITNSGGASSEVRGSLDPNPGFELHWEGEPPADKRPDADGLFSYSQFPRGMSLGELDWIIAGKCEQDGNGPRLLPLRFVGLKWQGTIYEYVHYSDEGRTRSYRGDIFLEAEASSERLEKALDEIYAQGFRPVYIRHSGEGDNVDFRKADAGPDRPEEQKKILRDLLEKILASGQDKTNCILVKDEAFPYLKEEDGINQYSFLAWVIILDMSENVIKVMDTNTERWVDLAFL